MNKEKPSDNNTEIFEILNEAIIDGHCSPIKQEIYFVRLGEKCQNHIRTNVHLYDMWRMD